MKIFNNKNIDFQYLLNDRKVEWVKLRRNQRHLNN